MICAVLVAVALVTLSRDAAAARAGAPAEGSPGAMAHKFGPGETFEYRVRFGFIQMGSATVAVGRDAPVEAGEVWPIGIDARTSGTAGRLYDLNTTFVTRYVPEEERTLGFDRESIERGETSSTRVQMDPSTKKAMVVRRRGDRPEQETTYDIGPATHDIASALFWLRDRQLEIGDVERVSIFTGRKAWEMTATVSGTENVRTRWGHVRTKHIRLRTFFDGEVAARRDIEVWMTDDDKHIPVAIRADLAVGSLRADLREYTPPRSNE